MKISSGAEALDILNERRAKSSLGDHSAGRIRKKNQQQSVQKIAQGVQFAPRGHSSTGLSNPKPVIGDLMMPKNKSHIESLNAESPMDNSKFRRPHASGNSNRRFKQNPHNKDPGEHN